MRPKQRLLESQEGKDKSVSEIQGDCLNNYCNLQGKIFQATTGRSPLDVSFDKASQTSVCWIFINNFSDLQAREAAKAAAAQAQIDTGMFVAFKIKSP